MKHGLEDEPIKHILEAASEAIQQHCDRLRDLANEAKRLWQEGLIEQRRLRQYIEEIEYRVRFAQQEELASPVHPSPTKLDDLRAREKKLRERDDNLVEELSALEALAGRLERLTRQTEVSVPRLSEETEEEDDTDPPQFALMARMLQGQEEERSRLAREIHDGPAQILANAIMSLEFCQQVARRDPAQLEAELSRLKGVMREGLTEVRRFIFDLRPSSLVEAGLRSTLERYVHDYEEHFGIKVHLCFPDLPRRLTAEQEMAIFRIVQEAMQNVKKHAEASQVWLDFARGPTSALVVTVRDDGKGFDARQQEISCPQSLGLVGMRERAELIQGKLNITSRPGHGTQVVLTVPNILPGPKEETLAKEVELRTELGF